MRVSSLAFAATGALALAACGPSESTSPDVVGTPVAQYGAPVLNSVGDGALQRADAKSGTTEAPGTDRGRFNITLKYVVPVSDRQREVFESAKAIWEKIIVKDVPSITGTIPSAFVGIPPASTGVLDDIVIEVALVPIDGPGRVLGSAGPRFIRNVDNLPVSGLMRFDTADLDFLDSRGLFEAVIVHEMGHVLGIGTLWNFRRALRVGPSTSWYFDGKFANVHWAAEGGTNKLPIETTGGPGTAGGHWTESVLRNELMTGFLNLGVNPLSRISAASLRDLGYGVGIVGNRFELAKGATGIPSLTASDASLVLHAGEDFDIGAHEELLEPIGVVPGPDEN